uniref:Uncharacterized protein n=1 Tax=Chenopodium quinoa TaxID=63459 RepID=A0A803LRP8_CHEQI
MSLYKTNQSLLLTIPIPQNPSQTPSPFSLPPPHPDKFKHHNHDKPLTQRLSQQASQLRPRGTAGEGGLLRPPFMPPSIIHLKLTQDRNIITKTKPIEGLQGLMSFYAQGLQGEWLAISPRSIRGILLNLEEQYPLYENLRMASAENPFRLTSAHVPSLSDVSLIIAPLGVLLKWWINKMNAEYSLMTVSWELQFLLDPAPVLPSERKALSITEDWLVLQSLSGTNNVKIMHLAQEAQQLHLSVGWGKEKGGHAEMSGIKIKKNTTSMFSSYQTKYVDLNTLAAYGTRKEMSNLPIMQPVMPVLLWNARGIVRDGFKLNIRCLIGDHNPVILILTETKVKKFGCEDLFSILPNNSFEVVDPVGYSGGIAILWNSGYNTVHIVNKEPRSIHVVVRVNSNHKFLFAIYAPTSYNARLDLWESLKNMSTTIVLPWLSNLVKSTPIFSLTSKNLFTSELCPIPDLPPSSETIHCDQLTTIPELKEAIHSIGDLKAPGIDGFNFMHLFSTLLGTSLKMIVTTLSTPF